MVAEVWTEKFRTLSDLCYLAAHYQRNELYETIDAYLDLFSGAEEPPAGDAPAEEVIAE
jgi:hypothetical protein